MIREGGSEILGFDLLLPLLATTYLLLMTSLSFLHTGNFKSWPMIGHIIIIQLSHY